MFPSEAEPLDLGSKALPWNQLILLFFSRRPADIVCVGAVSTADSFCGISAD
jgi:hypothetical protein